jgi:hypothetical protein
LISKNALKRAYYALVRPELPPGARLTLGYVVHTEAVWDAGVFTRLLGFCRAYRALTGLRATCVLMTGVNPLVRQEMSRHGVDEAEYRERVGRLAEEARLGYHGHFWFRREDVGRPEAEIMWNNYLRTAVEEQFRADLEWFAASDVSHHGIYAAGWWFVNRDFHRLLIARDFIADFSCSKSPWFRNQYYHRLMLAHSIRCGEPFRVVAGDRSLLCIQNLIGCHQTPFPQDFVRNLTALMDPGYREMIGVVNAHDFDLDPGHTLACLDYLAGTGWVTFADADGLVREGRARALREIPA